jgi:hypothetical protein
VLQEIDGVLRGVPVFTGDLRQMMRD